MFGFFSKKTDIRQLAEQGDAEARCSLALQYETGQGVPQDLNEAARWYRLAAEQGHAPAQFNLARLYASGRGVPFSDTEAAKWNRRAAEQDVATAQLILGLFSEEGRGVPQNYLEASKWHRRAAEQGDAEAQCCLGNLYAHGLGVQQDDAEAAMWFELAAKQGHPRAIKNLSVMAQYGRMPNPHKGTSVMSRVPDQSLVRTAAGKLDRRDIHQRAFSILIVMLEQNGARSFIAALDTQYIGFRKDGPVVTSLSLLQQDKQFLCWIKLSEVAACKSLKEKVLQFDDFISAQNAEMLTQRELLGVAEEIANRLA